MKNETARLSRNAYMRDYQKKWLARKSPEERAEWLAKKEGMRKARAKSNPAGELVKAKRFRDKIRLAVIEAYGGVCVCCGEDESVFLTIDHVEPIRRRDRSGSESGYALCFKLRKANYPAGYQILCFNCNHAKGTKVECPHRRILMNRIIDIRAASPLCVAGITA